MEQAEHKCPKCNRNLFVAKGKQKSSIFSWKVYSILTMVCFNPKCENYCGPDLSNPLHIVKTIKNKAN